MMEILIASLITNPAVSTTAYQSLRINVVYTKQLCCNVVGTGPASHKTGNRARLTTPHFYKPGNAAHYCSTPPPVSSRTKSPQCHPMLETSAQALQTSVVRDRGGRVPTWLGALTSHSHFGG